MLLKWTKTIQSHGQVKLITLPRLGSSICPYGALRDIIQLIATLLDRATILMQDIVRIPANDGFQDRKGLGFP